MEKKTPTVADNTKTEVVADFGEFGQLTKSNIQELFVDIHASISPLDPLNKAAEQAC